jgi:hypothetical protein
MNKLITDTFKKFFHTKTCIITCCLSILIVFAMIFVMPYILFKTNMSLIMRYQDKQTGTNISDFANNYYGIFYYYVVFTFPFYTSCLLIPIYIANVDRDNHIFILTRNYSRQNLFIAKITSNIIFALFFSFISVLLFFILVTVVNSQFDVQLKKYNIDYLEEINRGLATHGIDFNKYFLYISLMLFFHIFTVQFIITIIGFFLQKKATLYSILIALLFSIIFIIFTLWLERKLSLMERYQENHINDDLISCVYVSAILFLIFSPISIILGLTKYKAINLRV